MSKVAIIGYGYVGKAYHKMFPDAMVYDEPQGIYYLYKDGKIVDSVDSVSKGREWVNKCDMAIVCVPTDLGKVITEEWSKDGKTITTKYNDELDMSIIEDVVDWLETDLILIKSALQPSTTDKLVLRTGKNIAVSVEMVGEGKYYTPDHKYPNPTDPTKHNFLILGGEPEIAEACANILWSKMSPDIQIHLTTAIEAEITKFMENTWGAMKVTFANVMYDICQKYGASYIDVLQAWGADGRVEKMHMRVNPEKRGWKSKCYDKDVPALAELDESGFLKKLVEVNKVHNG